MGCQRGGINAGVILLAPCSQTLSMMLAEVTSPLHPEHIPGTGPEQDYLTRFFASAPWHALHVKWNYQLHHLPFALEHMLKWFFCVLGQGSPLSEADRQPPPRLAVALDDIGIVHFSGDVKLWHLCLESVVGSQKHKLAPQERWENSDELTERLLRDCCEGYARWVELAGTDEDYRKFGCVVCDDRVELRAGDLCEDVTPLVKATVSRLQEVARNATLVWRRCAEKLFN